MANIAAPSYSPKLTLDTLLARAGRVRQPHLDRRPEGVVPSDKVAGTGFARTPARIDPPQALVLVTTVAHCSCGATYRLPNASCLVRYDSAGHSNSVHYRREDVTEFLSLPRERKVHEIEVPFCEACFDREAVCEAEGAYTL